MYKKLILFLLLPTLLPAMRYIPYLRTREQQELEEKSEKTIIFFDQDLQKIAQISKHSKDFKLRRKELHFAYEPLRKALIAFFDCIICNNPDFTIRAQKQSIVCDDFQRPNIAYSLPLNELLQQYHNLSIALDSFAKKLTFKEISQLTECKFKGEHKLPEQIAQIYIKGFSIDGLASLTLNQKCIIQLIRILWQHLEAEQESSRISKQRIAFTQALNSEDPSLINNAFTKKLQVTALPPLHEVIKAAQKRLTIAHLKPFIQKLVLERKIQTPKTDNEALVQEVLEKAIEQLQTTVKKVKITDLLNKQDYLFFRDKIKSSLRNCKAFTINASCIVS